MQIINYYILILIINNIKLLFFEAHYEDVDQNDERVSQLWEALTNFTNADRSRFLRFVTGRRRLPAPMYICPDKG